MNTYVDYSLHEPPPRTLHYRLGEMVLVRTGIISQIGKIQAISMEDSEPVYTIKIRGEDSYYKATADYIKPFVSADLRANPDFSFIASDHTRKMVESGYRAVSRAEGWNILREFAGESFMFTQDSFVISLMNMVSKEYEGGHSGSSMGCTMRQLEYIAKHGFTNFQREWSNI